MVTISADVADKFHFIVLTLWKSIVKYCKSTHDLGHTMSLSRQALAKALTLRCNADARACGLLYGSRHQAQTTLLFWHPMIVHPYRYQHLATDIREQTSRLASVKLHKTLFALATKSRFLKRISSSSPRSVVLMLPRCFALLSHTNWSSLRVTEGRPIWRLPPKIQTYNFFPAYSSSNSSPRRRLQLCETLDNGIIVCQYEIHIHD